MTPRTGAQWGWRRLAGAFLRARSPVRPSLHAARVGEHWVVLDAAHGEYFFLHDPDGQIDVDAERILRTRNGEAEAALALAGLAGRAVEVLPPQVGDELGVEEEGDAGAPVRRASALDVAKLVLALGLTAWDLARPFPELVRARSARLAPRSEGNTRRQAALFADLLVWSPWQGECLFRSRWLLRFLQAQGCAADWVFGVRGWPLRAHCWVRHEGRLLNETPGAILAYRVLALY